MSIPSSTHTRAVFPDNQLVAQALPEELQQHICDFLSVHERPATDALACVNKLFKKNVEERRHLLLVADNIKNPPRSRTAWMPTAFQKHVETLAELSPALRTKVFNLLTKLTPFPHAISIASNCRLLWQNIHLLPASDRSQGILSLGKFRAHISYGLLVKLIDEAPQSDQAGLLGLLSYQLIRCSDAEFPALMQALFVKISHLAAKDITEALVQIDRVTGRWMDKDGSRYRQLFAASQQILLTLPAHHQVLPDGVWTTPTPAH